MIRRILCIECKKRMDDYDREPLDPWDSPYSVKTVRGYARRDYLCDLCGERIRKGNLCFARTEFDHMRPYIPWEDEYLEGCDEGEIRHLHHGE